MKDAVLLVIFVVMLAAAAPILFAADIEL